MPVSRAGYEDYEGYRGSTFSWQAADELLSALAASPSAHHHLAAVRQVAARAEALLGVPASFSAWNGGGSALLLAAIPQAMAPEERAEADSLIDALADSALPLASEVLERLDNERIRPELVGLSRPGLGSALTMLQQAHLEGSWRTLSDEELVGRCAELFAAAQAASRTRPLEPQRGEIGRVVAVLRRMPKQTVTRFTKAWNPILLRLVIAFNLRTLRKEAEEPFVESAPADERP